MSDEVVKQVPGSNRFLRRVVFIGIVIAATCSLILVMIPTLLVATGLGPSIFLNHERYRSISQDGQYEVRIYRRADFPAFDILDPSGTITIDIRKTGALGAFNAIEFQLHEMEELLEPELEWTSTEVTIDKIDFHNEYRFVLRFPEQ